MTTPKTIRHPEHGPDVVYTPPHIPGSVHGRGSPEERNREFARRTTEVLGLFADNDSRIKYMARLGLEGEVRPESLTPSDITQHFSTVSGRKAPHSIGEKREVSPIDLEHPDAREPVLGSLGAMAVFRYGYRSRLGASRLDTVKNFFSRNLPTRESKTIRDAIKKGYLPK